MDVSFVPEQESLAVDIGEKCEIILTLVTLEGIHISHI